MSPILVRPVREQIEHDRIIRMLQLKARRRYEAAINPGKEQNTAVGVGPSAVYPDLVLQSLDRGRRVEAVVEVETGESVNHLEALAEWAHYGRLRAAFHLYVPSGMVDVARRLCEDNTIRVSEIWSYHTVGDQVRFTLVHRSREVPAARPSKPAGKPATKTAAKPAAKAAKVKAAKPKARPAKAAARKPARPATPSKTSKKTARPKKRR